MTPRQMLDRIRRWLRSRQGRLVLIGAVAGTTIAGTAFAQEHGQPPIPAHGAQPPAVAAPQGSTEGHTGAHAAPHASGSAEHGGVHHPAPFNFADVNRYQAEKARADKGEKDEHGNPIVPVTPYAYLLINAAILFYIYYRAGKKPIMDGLQARHDTVAKELQEAARIKAEAEAQAKEYADKLARLEDELERIKADTIKAGEADRARIIREAEEKAERMKKDAQFLIDQELKQLRNDMIAFTAEAAVAAAEQVLKSKITPQDHDRLNDEFLKDVGGAS
jgi:F-type H+-transporting ATPase subunit b